MEVTAVPSVVKMDTTADVVTGTDEPAVMVAVSVLVGLGACTRC